MAGQGSITASPGAQVPYGRLMMLSSSPLPDITEFGTKKSKAATLRSGSAAVPIPASAVKSFTSAAELHRTAEAVAENMADMVNEPDRPAPKRTVVKKARKATKTPENVAKEVVVLSSDVATPKSDDNSPTTKPNGKVEDDGPKGSPPEQKPWREFMAHAGLEAADISPIAVEPQRKPKTQKKKVKESETVSRHFVKTAEAPKVKTRNPNPEPINLQPAVQRRTDWTPPRGNENPGISLSLLHPTGTNTHQQTPDSSPLDEPAKEDVFKHLHDAYAHQDTDNVGDTPNTPKETTLGKRKVIEMISINQTLKEQVSDVSPTKQKATKKKPRTITEIATAAYAPKSVDTPEDPLKEDSILEYFSIDKKGIVSKAAPGKGKGKAPKVTRKKAPPKQPVLLSPKAALRQSARQDFVFGTSSQLVREESPTVLRDLQAALRASSATGEAGPSAEAFSCANGLASESTKRGGKLWSVSARDEDGEVVNIEIIDLVDSSFPEDETVAILDPWKDLPPAASRIEPETAEPSLIEIESIPVASGNKSSESPVSRPHLLMTQNKITINAAAAAAAAAAASDKNSTDSLPLIADLLQEGEAPPPSNQEQSQEDVNPIPTTMSKKVQMTRPNYELFTDAKLAKEVSSFGFKPVKTRSGMLSLLDQCWKSRAQAPTTPALVSTSALPPSTKAKKSILDTLPATAILPNSKRPRGRPRKATGLVPEDPGSGSGPASTESPVKKRGRPRNDSSAAAGKISTGVVPRSPKGQPAVSTPKRRKASARPRKEMVQSDLDSDESGALSSAEEMSTSPGAAAIKMSLNEDTEMSLNSGPTIQDFALFDHITRAITSTPRTTDPDNPSWHEKMLMYDPVILEDLAAWLNAGQLTRVGYDGEASAMDVKKWCDSKSICCLWRENRRGKERKRL